MLIARNRPDSGICFAWTPKRTPDGTIWLERVHFERTGDAYDVHPWRYFRIAKVKPMVLRGGESAVFHAVTPPDVKRCKNYRAKGPTACFYPMCECFRK